MNEIVCVSGGFDCLHPGHIALFEAAAKYGDVIVILNSDSWLIEKKGYRVMNWNDRATIISALRSVSAVVPVNDKDRTICEALRRIKPKYFAKSGDRTPQSMPEAELKTCEELNIKILYDVCQYLPYSSSKIIGPRRNNEEAVWRKWGYYQVLDECGFPDPPNWKVKRLDVAPGQSLSLQRHEDREEHWIVVRGTAEVNLSDKGVVQYQPGNYVHVGRGEWHQLKNAHTSVPLQLIEVQMGRQCSELDIIRMGDEQKIKDPNDFKEAKMMVHSTEGLWGDDI